jgi:hypothetical protein
MRRRVSEWEIVKIWWAGRLTGCDRWNAESERSYTDQSALIDLIESVPQVQCDLFPFLLDALEGASQVQCVQARDDCRLS